MNEKEWTSELRKRMADYQEPVNDELWERIESTLSEKSGSQEIAGAGPSKVEEAGTPSKEKARIVPLRRWAAAAAALLLVVGGGYYIHKKVNTGAPVVETAVITEKAGPTENPRELDTPENLDTPDNLDNLENLDKLAHLDNLVSPSSPLSPSSPSHPSSPTLTIEEEKQELISHEERKQDEDLRASQSTETSTLARNDGNERMRKPAVSSQSVSSASHRSLGYEHAQTITTKKQEQPKMSAMLYAQNAMGGNDLHRDPVLMSLDKAAMYSDVEQISYTVNTRHAPIYLYNYEEITKHHQPVTFGLSLSYPLTSRLSVLSGVTYTKLSSDFIQKMNDTKVVNEQELHYVGVPVRLSYQLLSWKGFSLYGIAGGAADMNVKSSYATEGVKGKARKDRVQFSADAAAGVQYQVLPQMGLYVEPGVKYYLDNKSRVDNYFKDHPFNFNLQVGVRYELSR
ncbi:MAG: porin family protein [Prevotella sp.]|nr:porin family protein [Prevotella sp.]